MISHCLLALFLYVRTLMGVPVGDNRVAQDTHKATLGARFLPSLQKIRTRECGCARAAKMPVSCGPTSPTLDTQ